MCRILLQDVITTIRDSQGRYRANMDLLQRLDGKVKLEQFIDALRTIGYHELADKIEGLILLSMISVYISMYCVQTELF